jgi:hypothetical protein
MNDDEAAEQKRFEELCDAFRAGFAASGEGWNGEYPTETRKDLVETWLFNRSSEYATNVIDPEEQAE